LSLQQEFADFAAEADKSQFALEQEVDALSAERDALLNRFLA
ncbi:restriction endonuclease subunit S, partial [Collinsella sp. AM31-2AC]